LVSDYIDAGTLIYVLHPWWDGAEGPGTQAATAAECAGEQGEYWDMQDLLFKEQDTWLSSDDRAAQFGEYAQSLDLDTGAFETCLTSDAAAMRVLAGNVVGARYGVDQAPIFLFNNGQALQGSPTLEEFESMVNSIVNQ
jgi:protein-disulfide isomerase